MDLIEKAARVLADRTIHGSEADWEEFTYTARAVIEAIREPSATMMEAGTECAVGCCSPNHHEARDIWLLMIDQLLSDQK